MRQVRKKKKKLVDVTEGLSMQMPRHVHPNGSVIRSVIYVQHSRGKCIIYLILGQSIITCCKAIITISNLLDISGATNSREAQFCRIAALKKEIGEKR